MPGRDQPVIETINASAARQHWSELLNRVFKGETRVLVEKSGNRVAAVISADVGETNGVG
jgi:prevent-host-death family protein